jgi:Uma2 family endonuclease
MSTIIPPTPPRAIVYPDSDGKPMAENTLQFRWIVTVEGGLESLFAEDPAVFVAGDLLWYPVEGRSKIRTAPDALVAFGRPKGRRGSYKQWEEGGIAPQVVFEILSPGNRFGEMLRKFRFYERYGVEEYYIYNPDDGSLEGYLRARGALRRIPKMAGFVSPRLGIRFEPGEGPDNLRIIGPDERPFATYLEAVAQREAERLRAEELAQLAQTERLRAEELAQLAQTERLRAEEQAQLAQAERLRAEEQAQLAQAERLRAEQMAARLRELGIEPD